jgi:bifunctional non-homologous end joining protein LigD
MASSRRFRAGRSSTSRASGSDARAEGDATQGGEAQKNDALDRYRKKRDPGATNEPFGPQAHADVGGTWAGRFVVHQHDATRMHYDLRLEIAGMLQSFAVPKGPSQNPEEKRLAMHTEEHPLSYLDFEDVIPEGNYGAGAMIAWDIGGVVFLEASGEEGLRIGKLDFMLSGFKLHGRFALIATGKQKQEREARQFGTPPKGPASEWLLVKKPDKSADPEAQLVEKKPESVLSGMTVVELPRRAEIGRELTELARTLGATEGSLPKDLIPMICATEGAPLTHADWVYELKLDGVRILAEKDRDNVRLSYRSGRNATASYPEIARAVRALAPERLTLDGEIVTFDETGKPRFERLLPRIVASKPRDVERASREVPVVFLGFDLLALGGLDLRQLPLLSRKRVLSQLIRGEGRLRALDHIEARGDALWALAEQTDLEGIVAKRAQSRYSAGPRVSGDWVKIKRSSDAEFAVVGFLNTAGTNSLGSLLLASYSRGSWVYRGRVGSGIDARSRAQLETALKPLMSEEPPTFSEPELPRSEIKDVVWVRPELVARVRFQGTSDYGHLRAPVFLGLRADMDAKACTFLAHEEVSERAVAESTTSNTSKTAHVALERAVRVQLSNLDKVYFPDDGITKGDLLDYAVRISEPLLRFLEGRPVVLVRYPDGILGKNFYQWRAPEGTPSWIRTNELYDEEKQEDRGTGKATFLVDDLDALLHIVNLGCIPLHVLASREHSPRDCDFLTIDFDIGDHPFSEAVRLALSLREILDELGLSGYPKTSGQRGLHVLVPLGPGVPFDAAKLLCELLGRVIVGRHAQIATMERRKDQRGDRIYVDTGQTGRSRTIVSPYSVRAYPGARVSTPLFWHEVHLALDPAAFTIETVPERVEKGGDPLSGFFDERPNLAQTLATLGQWTKHF